MSEEKKTFELKDEELEKVSGGFTYQGQLPAGIELNGEYIIGFIKLRIKDVLGKTEGIEGSFECVYEVIQDFSNTPFPTGDIVGSLLLGFLEKVN